MALFGSKKPDEHCGSGLDKAPEKTLTEKIKDAIPRRDTGNGTAQPLPETPTSNPTTNP